MKQTRTHHSQVYKDEALALAERIGVSKAAEQLGLHASQLYDWRSVERDWQIAQAYNSRKGRSGASQLRLCQDLREAGLRCTGIEPEMGGRHHLPAYGGRLAVSGGGHRPALTAGDWLGRMTADLACDALRMALWRHKQPKGSGRDSQYCSAAYQEQIHAHHLRRSISTKGNCYDNESDYKHSMLK